MRSLLSEPLVHFAAAALLIFAGQSLFGEGPSEDEATIFVSEAEQERLTALWAATTGALPSDEDRQGLIAQFVEEEALAREARRLGLAEDDEIIRRRLAQKMRYVAGEGGTLAEPTDDELQQWLSANSARFSQGATRSFVHVFFSPEQHGDRIAAVAAHVRARLDNSGEWRDMGDPFLLERSYDRATKEQIARNFGPAFAEDVFALQPGAWSAPIGSAFGLHLVRVEQANAGSTPQLSAIREDVKAAYLDARAGEAQQKAIADIVAQYDVKIAGNTP